MPIVCTYDVKSQAWEYATPPAPPYMNHIHSIAIAYIAWVNFLCWVYYMYMYASTNENIHVINVRLCICICYVPVYMLCSSVLDYINYKISYTISITNNI